MSKFNTSTARARSGRSPIEATTETLTNHKGGTGFGFNTKSELFLAVISDFGGEKTFYESADNRSTRISELVRKVVVEDPEWVKGLAGWLRKEANLRSISLSVSLEGAKALNEAKVPGARSLVSSALLRADEPGEALAYWFANFGRKLPSAVKRGIADAAVKAFNEYSLAKYDTPSHGFRFGDVLELTHAKPKDAQQNELFQFALKRRRDTKAEPTEALSMLRKRDEILSLSNEDKRKLILSAEATEALKASGLTWEAVSGTFGKGGLDAKAWEALIPTMGYMALLRNLRNFEEAGVSAQALDGVAARLADPEQVAKSRQLPFRFLSAHRAVSGYATDAWGSRIKTAGSLRFVYPLEQALNASLANVPALPGKTLVLVDRSGSMFGPISEKTQLNRADSAAVFGSALAIRADDATLVEFGTSFRKINFSKSTSVLSLVDTFGHMGGTNTALAVNQTFQNHDRVIIVTDDEYYGTPPMDALPSRVKGYVWNLAGYRTGSMKPAPNRTYLGGLSDQSFKMIPMLEAGYDQNWPWEK